MPINNNHRDVIIVGGGLGGLACGAILAKRAGRKVLVLERENSPGGRVHHFKGDEIKSVQDYLGPLNAHTGRLAHSIPDIQTIVDTGLFKGYSFELGMHDIVNGKHSRMVHILEALGLPVEVVPLEACGFWNKGKLYPMTRGSLPWLDAQSYNDMRAIIGEMVKMPIEEVKQYNRISLLEYLEPRTTNPDVIEFFDILGAFTVGMNSARDLSAGEFILATRMPMGARLHFADGTLGQMGGESFMQMAFNFVDLIKANSGEVRTGSPVERIVIEDGVAKGVLIRGELVTADTVVCNVPIKYALSSGILPENQLPKDFVAKSKAMKSGGAFVPIFGLTKSVIDIPGMLMTKVPVDDPLLPDGVMLGYEAHSLFVAGKAPEGKEIIECWVGLSTNDLKELRETGRIRVLCDAILQFMKDSHPGFAEALEWALFPVVDHVISVTPSPEQAWDGMLDPKCPGVEGLFFVGDGVKNYGGFMDGTAYTALLTADAVSGGHHMEDILPPYQREI